MNIPLKKSNQSKLFALLQLLIIYGFIFNPWSSFPYTFVIIIIAIFSLTYWNDKTVATIGFKPKTKTLKTIGNGILLFVTLVPVLDFIVQPLVSKLTGEIADYSAFEALANNFSLYAEYFLYILISAGFGEEILFRGFLFRQLNILLPEYKFKTVLIVMLTAILFSLPHIYQGLSGLIITLIFGLIFATIYIKSNYNLWITIIFHGLVDIMFLTLAYYDKLDYYTLGNEFFFGF